MYIGGYKNVFVHKHIFFLTCKYKNNGKMEVNMNISNESLKLLNIVIKDNPKHSPKGHPCDYNRWIEFVISIYKNNDCITSGELYSYFIENGFENHTYEAENLVRYCMFILDFISHIDNLKRDTILPNCQWLIEKLNSK